MSISLIDDKWSDLRYSGTLPNYLYRYRPIILSKLEERVRFELTDEWIWLSGFGKLNDPDEGRILWTQSGVPVPPGIVSQFENIIDNIARVTCFSTKATNGPMWAHYAKLLDGTDVIDNAGLCIEYACDDGWRKLGLHPVKYSNGRPTVDMNASSCETDMAHALLVKTEDWKYEDEWRVLGFIQASPPFPATLEGNSKLMLRGGVKSVIFGLRTPLKVINEVRAILRASESKAEIKKIERDAASQLPVIVTLP